MSTRRLLLTAWAATTLVLLPQSGSAISLKELLSPRQTPQSPEPVAAMESQKAKQARFLKRIRQSDPSKKTISNAVFNKENELGIVLSRNVPMKAIPPLTKSLLTQLAKEFPGQDLNVLTYAPTSPPLKIGAGHLDARTRTMTYTPAR